MMIDDQRRRFSSFWKESEKVIGTILEKVFHSKLSLTPQISKEISIQNNWQNESFPKVVVSFRVVGAPISQHIFYFEPDTALYLFGTMIDSDPDLELTEEHLEGLKEACNQIWGQLQLVMEDWKDFQLDQLEVLKVETPQDLEIFKTKALSSNTRWSATKERSLPFIIIVGIRNSGSRLPRAKDKILKSRTSIPSSFKKSAADRLLVERLVISTC